MTDDRKGAGHTRGPWVAQELLLSVREIWIGVDHPEWGFVSHAEVREGCTEAGELGSVEANARLIAAAPDLLAFALAFEAAGLDSVGGIDVHELICNATGAQP